MRANSGGAVVACPRFLSLLKYYWVNEIKMTDQQFMSLVKWVVGVIVVLVLLVGSIGSVGTGNLGVKTRFGAVTGSVLQPGIYMKIPFIESVKKVNVQTQKEQTDAQAASSDLQNVSTKIAVNYAVDPAKVVNLFSTIGTNYKETVIDPAIQEAVKATTANFTAEELITKREQVSSDVTTALKTKLAPLGISVSSISIVNFDFSASFNTAIEAKVTAEQDALAAKNKLAQVQYEAQQAVEEAKGKASALTIESAAINSNPQILQLRAIEKWDGHLPQVTGSATPFINLK